MKAVKLSLIFAATALITLGIGSSALAFHGGGVAECAGCHTMHNSQDGAAVYSGAGARDFLMIAGDPSSTCLTCHAGYGQLSADGSAYRAGGDFYWMKKTFTWSAHGHAYESTGDSHGHNVVAIDYGIAADETLGTAPGGTYLAGNLGCNSCHDPHGKQGNELLLYGAEAVYPATFSFTAGAPVMESAGRKNNVSNGTGTWVPPVPDDPATTEVDESADGYWEGTLHSAYGSGMSAWCGNCHTAMAAGATDMHPTNATMNSTLRGNYNSYRATGDLTGTVDDAYLEAVPFETGTTDATTLDTNSLAGVDGSSKVMCLTCHRAHASAYPDAGRWDFGTELLAESHPMLTDGNATQDDVDNKDYGVTYSADQRSLCNKCHVQD